MARKPGGPGSIPSVGELFHVFVRYQRLFAGFLPHLNQLPAIIYLDLVCNKIITYINIFAILRYSTHPNGGCVVWNCNFPLSCFLLTFPNLDWIKQYSSVSYLKNLILISQIFWQILTHQVSSIVSNRTLGPSSYWTIEIKCSSIVWNAET